MLRKILQYLFNTLEGSPLPGKIENYFSVIDLELVDDNELDDHDLQLDDDNHDELDNGEDVLEGSEDEINSGEDEDQPQRKRARRYLY